MVLIGMVERDTGNQKGKSVLPGALCLGLEGASQLFSEDFFQDGTELLELFVFNFNSIFTFFRNFL
jgi:hypothetical protein